MAKHTQVTSNRHARFTNPSKFNGPTSPTLLARQAIKDGDALRRKLDGRRILTDAPRENAFVTAFQDATEAFAA